MTVPQMTLCCFGESGMRGRESGGRKPGAGGPQIFLSELKPEDVVGSDPILTVLLGSLGAVSEPLREE